MSKTCGDTARFNRLRKAKIARRQSARELKAKIALAHVPAVDPVSPVANSTKS